MPVQIGAKAPPFSDPTALMSDCHRRIEMFLGTLIAISKMERERLSAEEARAFAAALKYFREAGPKHTADEEESLFPRLRNLPNPDVQEVMVRVTHLEKDHREAEILHREVEQLGEEWLGTGKLDSRQLERFCKAVERLAVIYREHIDLEDRLIFPLAAHALSPEAKDAMGREMAARRG